MTITRLDYLRHGQPVGGSRYRGHGIDDPLSDKGWQQMRDTTSALGGWQRIISSPMSRCRAFADWLGEASALPVDVIDDLREVGFGDWEGMTRAELRQHRREEYDRFYRDPVNNRPAGAEPLDVFGRRVAAVFDTLVSNHPGEHMLVVCHAGVVRATFGHVTQSPAASWYRAEVDNAAVSRFEDTGTGLRLVAHNWRPRL